MIYSKVLEILYDEDLYKIIDIINTSVKADFFKIQEGSIVIHTGLCFVTHKNTKLELLYDIASQSCIRQVRFNRFPNLNGLVLSKGEREYFNYYQYYIITGILFDSNDEFRLSKLVDQLYSNSDYSKGIKTKSVQTDEEEFIDSFNLLDEKDQVLKRIPLSKDLEMPLYFDGEQFA